MYFDQGLQKVAELFIFLSDFEFLGLILELVLVEEGVRNDWHVHLLIFFSVLLLLLFIVLVVDF